MSFGKRGTRITSAFPTSGIPACFTARSGRRPTSEVECEHKTFPQLFSPLRCGHAEQLRSDVRAAFPGRALTGGGRARGFRANEEMKTDSRLHTFNHLPLLPVLPREGVSVSGYLRSTPVQLFSASFVFFFLIGVAPERLFKMFWLPKISLQ